MDNVEISYPMTLREARKYIRDNKIEVYRDNVMRRNVLMKRMSLSFILGEQRRTLRQVYPERSVVPDVEEFILKGLAELARNEIESYKRDAARKQQEANAKGNKARAKAKTPQTQ